MQDVYKNIESTKVLILKYQKKTKHYTLFYYEKAK